MASPADIPDELIDPTKIDDFITWVSNLPLDLPQRRELTRYWRKLTGAFIPESQWAKIERTSPTPADA